MKRASVAQARAELSALVNQVAHGKQRIIVTSHGHPKAALVGLDDLEALEDLPIALMPDESSLEESDRLVERINRERGGAFLSDSIDDLYAIREGAGEMKSAQIGPGKRR
ncbi:MAG: type II toxin-antitoxin system Phd/YefM family antitoxin [Chloroflexi bacterium]|nr:type II toxin-antitoxin system Phd/YefM family antitoxin [Chloroflexota bacterium]